jgi:hypothetical protein
MRPMVTRRPTAVRDEILCIHIGMSQPLPSDRPANRTYYQTPDHGINFDNESAIKAPLNEEHRDLPQTIAWFRTIVQDSKMSEGTHWPDHSQEWGTVSLGSIDTSIASVSCSPCGVSGDGR